MLRHTKRQVINRSFLQHALFCHVCNRSEYIISVKAEIDDFHEARKRLTMFSVLLTSHR